MYVFSIDEIQNGVLTYPFTALLGVSAISNEQLNGSVPEITSIVTGIKAFHLSGANNFRSPANALYDILTNTRYGYGQFSELKDIDKASFDYTHSYCYNHTPQLNCDITLDTETDIVNIVNDICQSFDGIPITQSGVFKILPREKAAPVMHINETSILENTIKEVKTTLDKIPNTLEIQFLNAEKDYERDTVKLRDKESLGKPEIKKTVLLKSVTNREQAIWLGGRMLRKLKYSRIILEFGATFGVIGCNIGDVITISFSDFGYSSKKFRILSMDYSEDFTFQKIICEEYSDAVYIDDLTEFIEDASFYSTLPNYNDAVKNPANLKLNERIQKLNDGTIENSIDVFFEKPADGRYSFAKIYISENLNANWKYCGQTYGNVFNILGGLESFKTYKIAVVSVDRNVRETEIDESKTISIYLFGKMLPPEDIQEFHAVLSGRKIIFTWTHISDIDLAGYEIRKCNGQGFNAGEAVVEKFAGNRFEYPVSENGTLRFWIRAIDTSGN